MKNIMNNYEVPILFDEKNQCCGCTACVIVCRRNAIRMVCDDEGFNYPEINKERCVGCNSCIKVCPLKN